MSKYGMVPLTFQMKLHELDTEFRDLISIVANYL